MISVWGRGRGEGIEGGREGETDEVLKSEGRIWTETEGKGNL
jgi:hypothetical protein